MVVRDLKKQFAAPVGFIEVFSGLSMDIPEGRITAVLGPSGCGKTTLLNCIAGFFPLDGGEIVSDASSDLSLSYLFQEPRLLPWRTVEQNIDIVLSDIIPDAAQRVSRVRHFLKLVGLAEAAELYPQELSGGMRQRVSIARAFAYPSDMLLMDEPFQALDLDLRLSLVQTFIRLWKENARTTIFVTHDIQEALLTADKICIFTKRPAEIFSSYDVDQEKSERRLDNDLLSSLERSIVHDLLNQPK